MTDVVHTIGEGPDSSRLPVASDQNDANPHRLPQFLQWLAARKIPEDALMSYNSDLQRFIDVCGQNVSGLNPGDIESYIRQLAHSGAGFTTLRRTRRAICEYYNFLIDNGDILKNPAIMVKITPVQVDVLSPGNILSIFRYITRRQQSRNSAISLRYRRDELILHLMLFFGARQYQIPFLKLSTIERNKEFLSLRIGDHYSVRLPAPLLHKLRQYLSLRGSASDIIFLDPLDGSPITHRTVHAMLRELNYRFEIRCSPVAVYHTFQHLQANLKEKDELISKILSIDADQQLPGENDVSRDVVRSEQPLPDEGV